MFDLDLAHRSFRHESNVVQHTPSRHQDDNDISSSTYNIIDANPQTVHSNSSLSMSVARHRPKNNPVNVHSLAPFPDDNPGMQRMIACWHG